MKKKSKEEIKNKYADLDEMIGNGIGTNEFTDGKFRTIHPISLKDFSEFMGKISIINIEALWTNFLQEDTEKAINEVLKMSFKDESLSDLIEVINAKNFPLVIKKIMSLNGIEITKDESTEVDKKNK